MRPSEARSRAFTHESPVTISRPPLQNSCFNKRISEAVRSGVCIDCHTQHGDVKATMKTLSQTLCIFC